jgi:BirA family biotin operon repressor/biotin-[acetyl-CoA-carboxylase] ligase
LRSNPPEEVTSAGDVPDDVRDALAAVAPRRGIFGCSVSWRATTSSTNDIAFNLADAGVSEGTLVVAETQTSGRGRMGRTWHSPPGAGLYVSIVLRPRDAALITLAAGVALAEGVSASTGLAPTVKWPNDLVIGKRKLAGVLAESAAEGATLRFVILGFGLNLRPAAYPPDLANRVTSIEGELNRPVDRALVLAEILAAMAARYDQLQHGRFDAILTAWRQRATGLRGSPVEWDSAAGVQRGRAADIDDSGALVVNVNGRTERLVAGEVRWL